MQVRCSYCQMMFPISREETLAALEHMAEHNQKYYDAHCPNCRRANRVERFKLEASYPNWQADLKAMVKEADQAQKQEAAAPAPAKAPIQEPPAKAPLKKTPPARTPAKPVKASAGKKPAAKKPASKGKKK